jgi:hypothetical protein
MRLTHSQLWCNALSRFSEAYHHFAETKGVHPTPADRGADLPPLIPDPEKQCLREAPRRTMRVRSTAASAPKESGGWSPHRVGHDLLREKPRSRGCTVAEPDFSVGAPALARGKDLAGASLSLRGCLKSLQPLDFLRERTAQKTRGYTTACRATEGSAPGHVGAGFRVSIQPLRGASEILRSAPKCLGNRGFGAAPPSGNQAVGVIFKHPLMTASRARSGTTSGHRRYSLTSCPSPRWRRRRPGGGGGRRA